MLPPVCAVCEREMVVREWLIVPLAHHLSYFWTLYQSMNMLMFTDAKKDYTFCHKGVGNIAAKAGLC